MVNKFIDILLWVTTRTAHDDIMWAVMDEYAKPKTNWWEDTKEMLTEDFTSF